MRLKPVANGVYTGARGSVRAYSVSPRCSFMLQEARIQMGSLANSSAALMMWPGMDASARARTRYKGNTKAHSALSAWSTVEPTSESANVIVSTQAHNRTHTQKKHTHQTHKYVNVNTSNIYIYSLEHEHTRHIRLYNTIYVCIKVFIYCYNNFQCHAPAHVEWMRSRALGTRPQAPQHCSQPPQRRWWHAA